jgi:Fic family protein
MITIGQNIKQIEGYTAFVPDEFPPRDRSFFQNPSLITLLSEADLAVGKLDGITKLLPDIDFFIFMYVKKEAAYSSQIEGTKAKLTDALQAEVEKLPDLPPDVDDILHYIQAMNEGLRQLESIPLSLRLIKEVHKVLLTQARGSHYAAPGEFRQDQNWIDGTSPFDARFVPPPAHLIHAAVGDIEKFFHEDHSLPNLIKAGLLHAQFETIHPFRDGNGRVGRLLVTFYLCQQKILERPVLYLSEFLKRNRTTYFDRLDRYRDGHITEWLEFFLRGVLVVASQAIAVSNKIVILHERDVEKIATLGKKTSTGAMTLLKELYKSPIVNARRIREVTGLSRQGVYNLTQKFITMEILSPRDEKQYGKSFVYTDYLKLFDTEK